MYNNKRVIINTKKYDVEEVVYRYEQGKIIFCESALSVSAYNKKAIEIFNALSKGIPFPVVYASELQTGELLILDKSDRLQALLKGLLHEHIGGQMDMDNYSLKDILYSKIIIYVIDYMNPKYMHMQVGNFFEKWSPTYEQGIRNILYKENGIEKLNEIIEHNKVIRKSRLIVQYNFIYFMMAYCIRYHILYGYEYEQFDKYQLLESTINHIRYLEYQSVGNIYNEFVEYLKLVNRYCIDRAGHSLYSTETKMKCMFFSYLSVELRVYIEENYDYESFRVILRGLLKQCDMSYRGIMETMDNLNRGEFLEYD